MCALIPVAACLSQRLAAETAEMEPAKSYLTLLENFAGWCEEHWNEQEEAFDAKGAGVTWPRGNGGVCITYAVLLTEFPDRAEFAAKKVRREVMLDHARRAMRSVALANKGCTHPLAKKPGMWGGAHGSDRGHWQSALETEHWVVAAHLLAKELDDDTRALVRQVAGAEADLCLKTIPQGKPGNTAADDCCWNAGLLGVCAAIFADDPRAAKWDEWAKRWALNTEAREPDRTSTRVVDGRPLGEWLVSTQGFPDLTLENHGFWDLPYQVCFAALSEPIVAHAMCGRKVPEAFYLNAREEGEEILKWLVLPDGDLLCPQGLDWAERDVQHQWAFTELGSLLDMSWARAAEARCLQTLLQRQRAFNDGSLHALDFGYQTDLANCWAFSFLLHKYFGKGGSSPDFDEPKGAKIFPHVGVGVFRSANMVSSVSWYGPRQAIMVVPNGKSSFGHHSLTAYRGDLRERRLSGLGFLALKGEKQLRSFRVAGDPLISRDHGALTVSFRRSIDGVAVQQAGYCALPTGPVLVFSKWEALADIEVAELTDHGFHSLVIPGWLPKHVPICRDEGWWTIGWRLGMRVLGGQRGESSENGVIGAVRRNFKAAKGERMMDTVCVYQAGSSSIRLDPQHQSPADHGPEPVATGSPSEVRIGEWTVRRNEDGSIQLAPPP
jgi:hypothetical protein